MVSLEEKARRFFIITTLSRQNFAKLPTELIAHSFPYERTYFDEKLPETKVKPEGLVALIPDEELMALPLTAMVEPERKAINDPTFEYYRYILNSRLVGGDQNQSILLSANIVGREIDEPDFKDAIFRALKITSPLIAVTFLRELSTQKLVGEFFHINSLPADKALDLLKRRIRYSLDSKN